MDDTRSDRSLRHSMHRAQQPNQWRAVAPTTHFLHSATARDQDFSSDPDVLKFRYTGVSPGYEKSSAIRGRHILHGTAGDRA